MNRELDVQVAVKVMDYAVWEVGSSVIVLEPQSRHYMPELARMEESKKEAVLVDSLPEGANYGGPAFSSSLDACARAEQQIVEMGLKMHYRAELLLLIRVRDYKGLHPEMYEEMMREQPLSADGQEQVEMMLAPAELRCRAMLAALAALSAPADTKGGE